MIVFLWLGGVKPQRMKTMFDLQDYKSEKQAILKNDRYSEKGKAEALAEVERRYKDEARKAVKNLRKDAVINALKLRDAQTKRIEKANEAMAKVDYARLSYEAQAARSKIEAAKSLSDIMTIWENAKRSNDAYVIKAWKDTSQGLINEKFGQENYTNLKAQLFNDIQQTQAEIAKVERTNEELEAQDRLAKIDKLADEINEVYGSGQSVIKRVFDGIGFEDGRVTLGFDYEVHKLTDKQETPNEVAYRVENGYQKAIEEYKSIMEARGFDGYIDADFDDLRGIFEDQ